jgi:PAS domain S-box-containing protein
MDAPDYDLLLEKNIRLKAKLAVFLSKDAEHQLHTLLESITDGLVIVDRAWRMTCFNRQGAEMLGLRSSNLLGHNLWDLFAEAVETRFYTEFYRAMITGESVQFEDVWLPPSPPSPNRGTYALVLVGATLWRKQRKKEAALGRYGIAFAAALGLYAIR